MVVRKEIIQSLFAGVGVFLLLKQDKKWGTDMNLHKQNLETIHTKQQVTVM